MANNKTRTTSYYSCFDCKNKFTLEELKEYRGKRYCFPCYSKRREICSVCGKVSKEENNIFVKGKPYCKSCYQEKYSKEEEAKRNSADYKKLIEFICNLWDLDRPPMHILAQISNFKKTYEGMTYRGMLSTLDYFYNIANNPVNENKPSVAIIPYVYDEARHFYEDLRDIKKNVHLKEAEKYGVKIVEILEEEEPLITGLIDIGAIEVEEDEEDYEF